MQFLSVTGGELAGSEVAPILLPVAELPTSTRSYQLRRRTKCWPQGRMLHLASGQAQGSAPGTMQGQEADWSLQTAAVVIGGGGSSTVQLAFLARIFPRTEVFPIGV